jgi:ankyrin repeat protein
MKKIRSIIIASVILSVFAADCFCITPQEATKVLFDAVQRGDVKQVLALLDSGTGVNCRDAEKFTPLIIAAKYSQMEIARALCDRGADVNAVADYNDFSRERGYTPLNCAAWNCDIRMAELLISRGAAVGQADQAGFTPLILAAEKGCETLARILVAKGAAISVASEINDKTALLAAVSGGHLSLADYLINQGADIKQKSMNGGTLLIASVAIGDFEEVRYFIEKGLGVNEPGSSGLRAMHIAANDRIDKRILEYLIEHGGDVSVKDGAGRTPLMLASSEGAIGAVTILISHGATVNDIDSLDATALHLACHGIPDPERGKSSAPWEATIKLLLEKGADVKGQNVWGCNALLEAAPHGAPQIIKLLLERGVSLDVQDYLGQTALMRAATKNRVEVIKLLADKGANLNLKDVKGKTALAIAKAAGSMEAYALLKSLGARD